MKEIREIVVQGGYLVVCLMACEAVSSSVRAFFGRRPPNTPPQPYQVCIYRNHRDIQVNHYNKSFKHHKKFVDAGLVSRDHGIKSNHRHMVKWESSLKSSNRTGDGREGKQELGSGPH